MFLRQRIQNSSIIYYLLCSLLLNSVFSFFSAANVLKQVNAADNGDAVIICTGSQFKWVSLSAFEQTGKLVYIDAPDNQSSPKSQHTCPIGLVADHQSSAAAGFVSHFTPVAASTNLPFISVNSAIISYSYNPPDNRAPPSLF